MAKIKTSEAAQPKASKAAQPKAPKTAQPKVTEKAPAVLWKDLPDEHDYPAARDYLQLGATPVQVQALVYALKTATLVSKKAKDILRAAGLPLLPVDNPHVAADLKKIRKGIALSPILLVQETSAPEYRPRSPTATTGSVRATTWTRTPASRQRSLPRQ
ncbi:hypothetical protein GCM10020255_033370 [Rhodococcus baikonurensis]